MNQSQATAKVGRNKILLFNYNIGIELERKVDLIMDKTGLISIEAVISNAVIEYAKEYSE